MWYMKMNAWKNGAFFLQQTDAIQVHKNKLAKDSNEMLHKKHNRKW